MNQEESQKIQVDFLLADFNSIKTEIVRRSGLQKTAYLLYLAGISWIFARTISSDLNQYYIVATWLISFISWLFIYREGLEIGRLANIVRYQICKELEKITGIDEKLFAPSEHIDPEIDNKTKRERSLLDSVFNLIVFVHVPAAITGLIYPWLSIHIVCVCVLLTIYIVLMSVRVFRPKPCGSR